MFYGWEDFKRDYRVSGDLETKEQLPGNEMDNADSRKQFKFMSLSAREKDASIDKLQRDLVITTEALKSEQSKHAETMARNKELDRELEKLIQRERGLEKQLEDQGDRHGREMEELKGWYENEMQKLMSLLETLEDAEERLVAQLGDLEAEAMEENRYFNMEINSLSQSLAQKNKELTSAQAELESMLQRKLSLKEMETMDFAAQLAKSKHDFDKMRASTEELQGELERARSETEVLKHELAMADLMSCCQTKERNTAVAEMKRKLLHLCRSDSLRLDMQRKYRISAIAV